MQGPIPMNSVASRARGSDGRLAGVVSALAGAPAGWQLRQDPRRRGSFLVLVVGTLALLAVITIVYVALGNQDHRTRAAAEKREQLDEVPQKMADYIAGVIANDAVAITNERNPDADPVDPRDQLLEYREATDAPGVRFSALSEPGLTLTPAPPAGTILYYRAKFNPEGTVPTDYTPPAGSPLDPALVGPESQLDRWYNNIEASDPWLASSEPVFLNLTAPLNFDPARMYLFQRDWFSISNLAPDGAFVNTANLRPEYGGFAASPETLRGTTNTSAKKTLYDASGNALTTTPWGDNVASIAAQNRPFYWTMYQENAYRPAYIGANESTWGGPHAWSDPNFRLYQWVDTDGDGMLDSRIFEMRRAERGANGVVYKDVLPLSGKYRWFFGTRVVDLSGRVNVNTAGDLASMPVAPSQAVGNTGLLYTWRVGTTPADIDLMRLLRQTDTMSESITSATWTLDQIADPLSPGDPMLAYGTTPVDIAFLSGTGAYYALRAAVDTGVIPPATSPADPALLYAFDGEFDNPGTASILDFWQGVTGAGVRNRWLSNYPQFPGEPVPFASDFPGQRRQSYLNLVSKTWGEYNASPVRTGAGTGPADAVRTTSRPTFGADDLAELLTREGINDPAVLSALEATLSARDANEPLVSPVRSTRSLAMEMGTGRRRYDVSLQPDSAVPAIGTDRDRALLQGAIDIRHDLTTISGARALRTGSRITEVDPSYQRGGATIEGATSGIVTGAYLDNSSVNPGELTGDELKLDLRAELGASLTRLQRSGTDPLPAVNPNLEAPVEADREAAMRRIFRAYADALAPYSDSLAAWPTTPPFTFSNPELRTLFYGYNGPETALLTAAHMAVNLRDMIDTDARPTVAALALSSQIVGTSASATSIAGRPTGGPAGLPAYPAWGNNEINAQGNPDATVPSPAKDHFRLSIDSRRIPAPMSQVIAPGVNVYGIEPQPFLTQVITIAAYYDSDGHNQGSTDNIRGTIPQMGSPVSDNPDLLFRMVAFTLTNPFDRDVTLSPSWLSDAEREPVHTVNNIPNAGQYVTLATINGLSANQRIHTADDFYYLQWGNRTFYLGELERLHTVHGRELQEEQAINSPIPAGQGEFSTGGGADELDQVIVRPITIRAGKSVVCYAISSSPKAVLDKLRAITPNPVIFLNGQNDENGWVTELLKGQVIENSPTGLPNPNDLDRTDFKWIGTIVTNPTAPEYGQILAAADSVYDPIPGDDNPYNLPPAVANTAGAGETVNLWRTVRASSTDANLDEYTARTAVTPGSMFNGTAIPGSPLVRRPNIYENDQLMDRLRLTPEASDLAADPLAKMNVHLPVGNSDINGSDGDLDTQNGQPYMLTLWSACARRNDQKHATGNGANPRADRLPSDVIPAYCIEPKWRDRNDPWNIGWSANGIPTGSMDFNDFDDSGDSSVNAGQVIAKKDPHDWVDAMKSPSMYDTDSQVTLAPQYRTTLSSQVDNAASNTTNQTETGGFANAKKYSDFYPQINSAPPSAIPLNVANAQQPENIEDGANQTMVNHVRVTDALLPLGIGPQETPYVGSSATPLPLNDQDAFSRRYTTLGEALAIAQGYDIGPRAPLNVANPDQAQYWGSLSNVIPNASAIPEHELMFDRGNLHLDAFVPFLDLNSGGPATSFLFNPGSGPGDDRRVGLGIPAALNVLEQFTVSPAGNTLSLTSGVAGLININTATRDALRCVPFFSPPDLLNTVPAAYLTTQQTENWWMGVATGAQPYPQLPSARSPFEQSNAPNVKLDLASVVDAYRFKYNVQSRTVTGLQLQAMIGLNPVDDVRQFLDTDPTTDTPGNERGDYADITGLSDLVGLRSVGELLAVRQRQTFGTSGTPWNGANTAAWSFPLGVDFMGLDKMTPGTYGPGSVDVESSVASLESFVTTPLSQVTVPSQQPTTGNEYDEKLAIAGAAIGTTSVRSDVFAVWFVAMGYQPSDVDACISADDPLVPSVQRRFLMIVDRSNVTKKDQKPKVLLFKEVPM
ncbi:MAG: hypothetical protein U0637_13395 [Phycisphaerales bacterium]